MLRCHVPCAVVLLPLTACMQPSKDAPGVEKQPDIKVEQHPSVSGREPPPDAPTPGDGTTGTVRTPAAVVPGIAPQARATFQAAPGVPLAGEADLKQVAVGVQVNVRLTRGPSGLKGIHVHEKGDCSDIPGKSMGGHFALAGQSHGFPDADRHHLGDLGNVEINEDGTANFSITALEATLIPGDAKSFLGKAIVIHEKRDQGTGESGESGKPIGCAIIEGVDE